MANAGPNWQREIRGLDAYHSGLRAETRVKAEYEARSCGLLAERWRGKSGEIDLIFRQGEVFVFVEVKKAASLDLAAARIFRRQMDRICRAACEFLIGTGHGCDVPMRFDAALIDATGAIEIIENAFCET